MPQSSLLAWLNKPVSVKEPPGQPGPASKDHVYASRPKPAAPLAPHISPNDAEPAGKNVAGLKTSTSTLPPNVKLRKCNRADIPALKRMNSLLLPIPYSDSFYRETIEDAEINSLALLAIWHDQPVRSGGSSSTEGRIVGAIRCKLLPSPDAQQDRTVNPAVGSGGGRMLYISTLVLLSPYRSHGLASAMLEATIETGREAYGVTSVGAHVWEANQEGLDWYRKRGFSRVRLEDGYYKRLHPQRAVVVQRKIGVLAYLKGSTVSGSG